MVDPALALRLAGLLRQRGLPPVVAARSIEVDERDVADRVDALRTAARLRDSQRQRAAAALPGVELAAGVRYLRAEHPWRSIAEAPHGATAIPWGHAAPARRPIFIDTETTGLSGGTGTLVFLFGTARWEASGGRPAQRLITEQWLLTSPAAESAFLQAISTAIPDGAELVSYNGRAFDLPLLAARFRMNRMANPWRDLAHDDLLPVVRRAFATRWPDCRLGTAEARLLGQPRVDDLPGSFAPLAFQNFLRNGETELLLRIIEHHRRDVVALAELRPALLAAYQDPGGCDADAASIARYLLRIGRIDDALRIVQSTPSSPLQLVHARWLKRQRRYAEAAAIYRSILQCAAGCTESLEALAKLAEHVERDIELAMTMTRRLLELQPASEVHQLRHRRLSRRLAGNSSTGRG